MELALLLLAMVVGLSVGTWLERRQERRRRVVEMAMMRRLQPMRLPLRPEFKASLRGRLTTESASSWSARSSELEAHSDPTRRSS